MRPETLSRLASEIASALKENHALNLVIGHGSGSFGHYAASKHHTRQGVHTKTNWEGFIEVYKQARRLNQFVLEALLEVNLPVISLPPSSSVISRNGTIQSWDIQPIQAALSAGLIPLINGDVIFDSAIGGTILSTEELFSFLAERLNPSRILLAGLEPGVWADFPTCTRLEEVITPDRFQSSSQGITSSSSLDVTGGMRKKVESMLAVCQNLPGLNISIFSGEIPGLIEKALSGEAPGTVLQG